MSVSLGPLSLALGHLLVLLAFVLALLVGGLLGRRYRQPGGRPGSGHRLGGDPAGPDRLRDRLLATLPRPAMGRDRHSRRRIRCGLGADRCRHHHRLQALATAGGAPPLTLAAGAGLLFWSFTAGTVALIERQARGLPALSLPTLSEASVPLSGLAQGQPMVINLWATWCPPCVREMPVLAEAQQRYPEIRFVFVNQGEPPETIRRFLQNHGLRLEHVLLDTRGELARAVGSHGLPTTLFYNARGQQVASHMGALSQATLARGLERLRPATP